MTQHLATTVLKEDKTDVEREEKRMMIMLMMMMIMMMKAVMIRVMIMLMMLTEMKEEKRTYPKSLNQPVSNNC